MFKDQRKDTKLFIINFKNIIEITKIFTKHYVIANVI